MSLSTAIAPHLPFLRRFARAVSGSQESGDALVATLLEAMIADTGIFPQASTDRIALYKTFTKMFTPVTIRIPEDQSQPNWEQRTLSNLSSLAPRERQAFLLITIEGFSPREAAEVLEADEEE